MAGREVVGRAVVDVADGDPSVRTGKRAQGSQDLDLGFEEIEGVVTEHEVEVFVRDRPRRRRIEADEPALARHHPVAREPELGEDDVPARERDTPAGQFAPVVSDAAGEFEGGPGGAPMCLDERQTRQERRVAPAMGEVVADAAESEGRHGVAEPHAVPGADEFADHVSVRSRARPPIVLIAEGQHQRTLEVPARR